MDNLDFESVFTEENASKVASYIIDRVAGKDRILDYDFHDAYGKFVSEEINTWFKFDTEKGTILGDVLAILSSDDVEVTQDRIILFDNFRKWIGRELSTTHKKKLTDTLRTQIFGDKLTEEECPMDDVKVISFEIGDLNRSSKYLILIRKTGTEDIAEPVSADMFKFIEQFDKDETVSDADLNLKANEYVKIMKASGSPLYKNVTQISLKKEIFECYVELFVDYSKK